MSTIKSSDEHLTLNADGASKDIKFQANGVEKASISSSGAFTSTTIDATALTGALPAISGANLTGVGVAGISSSADATAMTITSAEKIGIGTASPDSKLHVKGTASTTNDLINSLNVEAATTGTAANGVGTKMTFYGSMSGQDNVELGQIGFHNNNVSGANGDFVVKTRPNGTSAERLRITSDGRGLSQFTAKAWLNFNDTTINDSHNISSMTDIETGMSYANFSNNMANTNYAVSGMAYSGNCDKHGPYIAGAETNRVKILSLLQTNCNYDDRTTHIVIFGD